MLDVQLEKTLNAGSTAPFKLDLRFKAAPGVLILFGASGAGKSLTLQLLAGLQTPDQGTIQVGDWTKLAGGPARQVEKQAIYCWPIFESLKARLAAESQLAQSIAELIDFGSDSALEPSIAEDGHSMALVGSNPD